MSYPYLKSLTVSGFKSIRDATVELGDVNVLIGANGAGKSNLLQFFLFLRRLAEGNLQIHVAKTGGANNLLHYGRKITSALSMELVFRQSEHLENGYSCVLFPTDTDTLVFAEEKVSFHDSTRYEKPMVSGLYNPGGNESVLRKTADADGKVWHTLRALLSLQVYHFHDTSVSAKVKQYGDIHDNVELAADAGNLAAYLYLLRETSATNYRRIVETIRLVAPFFDDFVLRPLPKTDLIRLSWRERGRDTVFGAEALSDGTLRFICLATLLLQPADRLPDIIIIDEPELGLHPYALAVLAEMVHSVAGHCQVILSTQSAALISHFSPEEVIVVEREGGATVFERLDTNRLSQWLDEYTLGDLWQKNLVGGRPRG